eukprot:gene25776-biopygen22509
MGNKTSFPTRPAGKVKKTELQKKLGFPPKLGHSLFTFRRKYPKTIPPSRVLASTCPRDGTSGFRPGKPGISYANWWKTGRDKWILGHGTSASETPAEAGAGAVAVAVAVRQCKRARRRPHTGASSPPSAGGRQRAARATASCSGCWRSVGRNGCGRVPDASRTIEFEETDASRTRPQPFLPTQKTLKPRRHGTSHQAPRNHREPGDVGRCPYTGQGGGSGPCVPACPPGYNNLLYTPEIGGVHPHYDPMRPGAANLTRLDPTQPEPIRADLARPELPLPKCTHPSTRVPTPPPRRCHPSPRIAAATQHRPPVAYRPLAKINTPERHPPPPPPTAVGSGCAAPTSTTGSSSPPFAATLCFRRRRLPWQTMACAWFYTVAGSRSRASVPRRKRARCLRVRCCCRALVAVDARCRRQTRACRRTSAGRQHPSLHPDAPHPWGHRTLAREWRGNGAGVRLVKKNQPLLAWVTRAWRGHGAGLACDPWGKRNDPYWWEERPLLVGGTTPTGGRNDPYWWEKRRVAAHRAHVLLARLASPADAGARLYRPAPGPSCVRANGRKLLTVERRWTTKPAGAGVGGLRKLLIWCSPMGRAETDAASPWPSPDVQMRRGFGVSKAKAQMTHFLTLTKKGGTCIAPHAKLGALKDMPLGSRPSCIRSASFFSSFPSFLPTFGRGPDGRAPAPRRPTPPARREHRLRTHVPPLARGGSVGPVEVRSTPAGPWVAPGSPLGRHRIAPGAPAGRKVARAWRGRGAGYRLRLDVSGAGVARAWRGRGAGISCSPWWEWHFAEKMHGAAIADSSRLLANNK